jgi:hypothetical protein
LLPAIELLLIVSCPSVPARQPDKVILAGADVALLNCNSIYHLLLKKKDGA